MSFLNIIYNIRTTTQFVMVAGILSILYGLVFHNYPVALFGGFLWLDGRNVWYRYIDKYTIPKRPNEKTHSGKRARDESGRPQFSEKYRK